MFLIGPPAHTATQDTSSLLVYEVLERFLPYEYKAASVVNYITVNYCHLIHQHFPMNAASAM